MKVDQSTQQAPTVDPVTLRISDAAQCLGLSRPSIYKLIRQGDLRCVKIAGRSLVPFEDIKRLVAEATRRSNTQETTSSA